MKPIIALLLSLIYALGVVPARAENDQRIVSFVWLPMLDDIYVQYFLTGPQVYAEAMCDPTSDLLTLGMSNAERLLGALGGATPNIVTWAVDTRPDNSLQMLGMSNSERLLGALGHNDQMQTAGSNPQIGDQVYVAENIARLPTTWKMRAPYVPSDSINMHAPLNGVLCGNPNIPIVWQAAGESQNTEEPLDDLLYYDPEIKQPFPDAAPKDGFFFVPNFTQTNSADTTDNAAAPDLASKFPILLIPGHLVPALAKCETSRDKVAAALQDYRVRLNFRREVVQILQNRVNEQAAFLANLRLEQAELEQMDASGTSEERLAAARAQGLADIATAVLKLQKLQVDAVSARQVLDNFREENPSRDALAESALEAVKKEVDDLRRCLDRSLVRLARTSDTTGFVPDDLPDDPEISDLPDTDEPPSEDQSNILNPKVAYSAVMDLDGFKSRIFYENGRSRYEPIESPGIVSIILDDQGLIWQLFLDMGTYVEMEAFRPVVPSEMHNESLGEEVINGVATTKYHIEQQGVDGYESDGMYWISAEGITVKSEVSEIVNGIAQNVSMELSELVLGAQADDLFELPDYLKLQTFPAMPSGN